MVSFSKKLKRAIELGGISQASLARMSGLTEASISRYLAGKRTPDATCASRIANALNVSLDELIDVKHTEKGDLNEALLFVMRNASKLNHGQKRALASALIEKR